MKLEEIKNHWEKSGESFSLEEKVTPTSRDPYLGEMERENILTYLNESYNALEVGCGDAFHTIYYAKKVNKMSSIDLASSLIEKAKHRISENSISNVDLFVGSVLDLEEIFQPRNFDCVISQRCLINLPNWDYQKEAIKQIYNLLDDDGIFLLTEGFQENLDNLNSVRKKLSLDEIKVVEYNRNFTLSEFEPFIHEYFEIIEKHYYGAYLFFSRVYHPLAVLPETPKHDSNLNKVAMDVSNIISTPDLEKYSYNIFYVLKKRLKS